MKRQEYTSANRAAMDVAALVHEASTFERLKSNFQQPGYSYLDEVETQILEKIVISGKSIAQLCCNNGRELLSLKNLGAGQCVGFDISDEFIRQAIELSRIGNIDCEFVQSDVYEIPAKYDGEFEVVYVTVGSIRLLPDLEGFFQVIARLLRAGGTLFIYEMHPILDMYTWRDKHDPPTIENSYFRVEPFLETKRLNYWDMTTFDSPPLHWFHYKLSDIISACLASHLKLELFKEYAHDRSNSYAAFEKLKNRLPLSYAVVAKREQE